MSQFSIGLGLYHNEESIISDVAAAGTAADRDVTPATLFAMIDPRAFLSIMLFALYWAWIFSCYWGGAFNALYAQADHTQVAGRFLSLLTQAAGFGTIAVFWRFFSMRRGRVLLSAYVAFCSPLVALCTLLVQRGVAIPSPLILAAFFLFGCSHACLFQKIGILLDAHTGRVLSLLLSLAVFFSCALYFFSINLPETMQSLTIIVMPFIGLMMLAVAKQAKLPGALAETDLETGVDTKPAHEVSGEFAGFFIQLLIYSLAFAAIQLFISSFEDTDSQGVIMTIATALTGIAMFIYGMVILRYMPAGSLLWYLLPLMALGLLPLSVVNEQGRGICYLVVAFGFTCFDMMSVYQLTSFIRFHNLPVTRYFALGRFANALGMTLGWGFASLLLSMVGTNREALLLGSIVLVSLLVLTLTFLHGPRLKRTEKTSLQATGGAIKQEGRPWKQFCMEICNEYDLTIRESEVFTLLCKGRTARSICEKLFISESTAKSHIYHIYRKTELHSQQQIIEMVDKRYHSSFESEPS
jgi:DNA-binding CsgD family transcriptional regulator